MKRPRVSAAAGFLALMLTAELSRALSPPPPEPPSLEQRVLNAEIIVAGTPTRYYYKGMSSEVKDDYQRIFESPGKGRGLFAILRVEAILKNETDLKLPSAIHVAGLLRPEEYASSDEKARKRPMILLIRSHFNDATSEGNFRVFNPSEDPLGIDRLDEVKKLTTEQRRKSK